MSKQTLSEFIRERSTNGPIYMPYLTVGDPDFESTVEFAVGMIDAGAELLELGIPFSDPTADGPTIEAAMVRSISQPDFSIQKVFEITRQIHAARPATPLIYLSYANPVLNGFNDASDLAEYDVRRNINRFLEHCQSAGVQAVVIPDLPHDQPEAELFRELAGQYCLSQILMVAPNTGEARLAEICKYAQGFIYYVTSLGVTGMQGALPVDLQDRVRHVRETSGVPVLAGFGISKVEQVAPLRDVLDGIIVGSKNHSVIAELGKKAGAELNRITAGFVAACRN